MLYSYANLADVWRQAKPVLQQHGLVLTHPVRTDGERCFLQTVLYHAESQQWIGSEIILDVSQSDSRQVGARMSFMRRYCSLALLAIPTSDDDEARYFGEIQRAERREEAKERKRALQGGGQRGANLPVADPPPAPNYETVASTPPPQPPVAEPQNQQAPSPEPPRPPTPQPPPASPARDFCVPGQNHPLNRLAGAMRTWRKAPKPLCSISSR